MDPFESILYFSLRSSKYNLLILHHEHDCHCYSSTVGLVLSLCLQETASSISQVDIVWQWDMQKLGLLMGRSNEQCVI